MRLLIDVVMEVFTDGIMSFYIFSSNHSRILDTFSPRTDGLQALAVTIFLENISGKISNNECMLFCSTNRLLVYALRWGLEIFKHIELLLMQGWFIVGSLSYRNNFLVCYTNTNILQIIFFVRTCVIFEKQFSERVTTKYILGLRWFVIIITIISIIIINSVAFIIILLNIFCWIDSSGFFKSKLLVELMLV